jgi:uncharacterized membrane protein YbhN (UPF0104 family)
MGEVTDSSEPSPSPEELSAAASAPAKKSLSKRVVSLLIALAALAFVVRMVPLRDRCTEAGCVEGLLTVLRRANVPLLVVLFGMYIGGSLAWAARWRALLALADVRLSLRETWRITLEAQAGGILLPGGVAGDALRVAYVRTRAPRASLPKIVASIFADRVVGLVTLATLASVAAGLIGGAHTGAALPIVGGIPLAALAGWYVVSRPSIARSRFLTAPGFRARLVQPMLEYTTSAHGPRVMRKGLLLSLAVSGVQLLVVRGLVAALGVTPTHEAWIYIGGTLGMMVAAVPVTPGAWGTADAAYVLFLGEAGVAPPVAAAVCLLYRVFWYASGLLGAGFALARRDS